jgi:UDP-N-acetylmuramate dehydrogenase
VNRSGPRLLGARSHQPTLGRERFDAPFAELTTLRLGGPARRLVEAAHDDQIIEAVSRAQATGEPLLVLAGGSNLVVADAGFEGTAVRILTRGVSAHADGSRVRLAVAAGEPWESLVARCIADGLAGVECLAGIPGSTGATPIQNVGAYGQQVSEVIASLSAFDRAAGRVIELLGEECGFAYRSSMLRHSERYVVLGVTFELERSTLGRPIRYPELARTLDVAQGARAPLAAVSEAVLALRRGKGMVLDPGDPDSVSAGSFFLNPVLTEAQFAAFARRVRDSLGESVRPPAWPEADGAVKLSAAWLIERAGFHRGFGEGRVGLSTKHTLALVNHGGASTAELIALAREIRGRVQKSFGITLHPEPTLVGIEL